MYHAVVINVVISCIIYCNRAIVSNKGGYHIVSTEGQTISFHSSFNNVRLIIDTLYCIFHSQIAE